MKTFEIYTLVMIITFIDHICISLIVPLLNKYFMNMGVNDFNIGLLWAVYGLLQMIASPIIGKFSDCYSRFLLLLICLLGTCFSYGILLFPNQSFLLMLFSRVFTGCFKHSRSLFKSIIAVDVNILPKKFNDDSNDTLHKLATLNVVSNVGFVVGPLFMTFLNLNKSEDLRTIIRFACYGYCINIVLLLFTYNLHKKNLNNHPITNTKLSKTKVTFNLNQHLFWNKNTGFGKMFSLMSVRFSMVSAILVFRHDLYRHMTGGNHGNEGQIFTPQTAAYIFSLSSAFSSAGSFVAVLLTSTWAKVDLQRYTSKFISQAKLSSASLYQMSSLLYATSMLWTGFWILSQSIELPFITALNPFEFFENIKKTFIVAGILCNSIANSWCRTLLDDLTIKYGAGRDETLKDKSIGKSNVGELIGTGQSVSSMARIVSPLIAGTCQRYLHFDSPLIAGGLLALLGMRIAKGL